MPAPSAQTPTVSHAGGPARSTTRLARASTPTTRSRPTRTKLTRPQTNSLGRASCHKATNANTTPVAASRFTDDAFAPSRGRYTYATSHRLKDPCQPRQNPAAAKLSHTKRPMFSGGSTPSKRAQLRATRHMKQNLSQSTLIVTKAKAAMSTASNRRNAPDAPRAKAGHRLNTNSRKPPTMSVRSA